MIHQPVFTETKITPFNRQHIVILDGFRGLAILLVIAMHYCNLTAGWTGVDLFFVLSGLLITWKLQQSLQDPGYYRKFYQHRILRIWPLYFSFLIVVFFIFPALAPSLINSSYREMLQIQPWYWTFAQNCYNAAYGWPANISILHFWSLATEMQFYLLWPFVIKYFYQRIGRIVIVLLLLISLAVIFRCTAHFFLPVTDLYRYVLLPSRIDAFAFGALLFFLIHNYNDRFRKLFLQVGAIISVLLIVLYVFWFQVNYTSFFTSRFGYTLFDVAWCAWIGFSLLTKKGGFLKSLLSSRFMVAMGKYSYAMYVFHLPVWTFINRLLENRYGENYKDSMLVELGLPPVVFMIVYLLSLGSYHCFEKYFLRLKN